MSVFRYSSFTGALTLMHIYHEWGHKGWSIWDFVEELEGVVEKSNYS